MFRNFFSNSQKRLKKRFFQEKRPESRILGKKSVTLSKMRAAAPYGVPAFYTTSSSFWPSTVQRGQIRAGHKPFLASLLSWRRGRLQWGGVRNAEWTRKPPRRRYSGRWRPSRRFRSSSPLARLFWTGFPLTVTGGFFKIFGRNLPLSVKIWDFSEMCCDLVQFCFKFRAIIVFNSKSVRKTTNYLIQKNQDIINWAYQKNM